MSKWICCCKEMPEKLVKVLVVAKDGKGNHKLEIGEYITQGWVRPIDGFAVTHWLPIPPIP